MTDYIGAKLEGGEYIGIVDRRENDRYIVKWTNRETGRTWEWWWPQAWLDEGAAGKYPGWTVTVPKSPQAQLREWLENYD